VHTLWCWITANAEAITAIVAVLSAIFTGCYFIYTVKIFLQTRRSADSAQTAANSAQSSASTAEQSINLIRRQTDEQEGLGTFRVESAIKSALEAIDAILAPPPFQNAKVYEISSRRR
jgi:hypothetical protein